jgi:hypothetical protein
LEIEFCYIAQDDINSCLSFSSAGMTCVPHHVPPSDNLRAVPHLSCLCNGTVKVPALLCSSGRNVESIIQCWAHDNHIKLVLLLSSGQRPMSVVASDPCHASTP